MSFVGRKRASLVLLLVLAAGLAAAGAAAAAGAQGMECCPSGRASGCTWLGAGDCCSARPGAAAQPQAVTPAAASVAALTHPVGPDSLPVLPPGTLCLGTSPRSLVLRL